MSFRVVGPTPLVDGAAGRHGQTCLCSFKAAGRLSVPAVVARPADGVSSHVGLRPEGGGRLPSRTSAGTPHENLLRPTEIDRPGPQAELLRVLFTVAHDPTEKDRQGQDVGSRYRSELFYEDDGQRRAAADYISSLEHARMYSRPIVTRVVPLDRFVPVEPDQQDFATRHPDNPYIRMYDPPRLDRFRRELPELYQERLAARREVNASAPPRICHAEGAPPAL
jgi:peptide-methionine (S)-S-oxide reductase